MNIRNWLFIVILIAIAGLSVWFILRQKTGYVNIMEVFEQFEYTKQIKKDFEIIKNARQRKLDSLNFELKILAQKLQTSKDKELMTTFEVKRRDFIYEKELSDQNNDALTAKYDEQIHKQMQAYILDYGSDNGYDYLFGTENLGTVLYSKDKYNITSEVVSYINKRFKAKK